MLDMLFRGLFDSELTSVISVSDFLLCLGFSLAIGLIMSFTYMYRTRYTKSFVVTLALLPAVVCVVIMLVNGNVGTGVAVAGAFSLVRFRSVPGTAKEICALFLAMGSGLIAGMGYLGFAVLFTVVMCAMFLPYNRLDLARKETRRPTRRLPSPSRRIWITPGYLRIFLKAIRFPMNWYASRPPISAACSGSPIR